METKKLPYCIETAELTLRRGREDLIVAIAKSEHELMEFGDKLQIADHHRKNVEWMWYSHFTPEQRAQYNLWLNQNMNSHAPVTR